MPQSLTDRRALLAALAGAGAALAPATGASAAPARKTGTTPPKSQSAGDLGLAPDTRADQSAVLQRLIDEAAVRGRQLTLPAGRFHAQALRLRPGTLLAGAGERTVLVLSGPGPLLRGEGAHGMRLERLALEGVGGPIRQGADGGLVDLDATRNLALTDVTLTGSAANGLVLRRCSGRVTGTTVTRAALAGLLSLDAEGLSIESNRIADCANNGILVWRSTAGVDGTRVAGNRIERIGAAAGGSGQNGNGINVFRAAGVLVTGNRITDCAYSAVRANAASNVQMVANGAERIGEVALYAEFGFEGALIAQNLVDRAACGVSVTNFNEGGRLAVIQGNLIRNLVRREHEPVDKRGEGIAVEADAAVTGNTIEGAPTAGIVIGWGPFMRDVSATGNVIRKARVGIAVSRDPAAGSALVAQNLISETREGAVRLMDKGRLVGDDLVGVPPVGGRVQVAGNVVGQARGLEAAGR